MLTFEPLDYLYPSECLATLMVLHTIICIGDSRHSLVPTHRNPQVQLHLAPGVI